MHLRLLLLIAFFVLSVAPAYAVRKVALVIGNNTYDNLPDDRQLKKAINDARAMREVLNVDLGFEVLYDEDVDWLRMSNLIKQLETKVGNGDLVFVYFSGHGVSIGGENYLLPSDIPTPRQGQEARLIGNSFGAEALTQRIQRRGAQAIFAILDACRDNPFFDEGGKSVGNSGGLTNIEKAEGVFTLFAAGLGEVALDRLSDDDPNPNSVFTRSLIPLLKIGGLSHVDLAKKVQEEVVTAAAKIGHKQMPVYDDGLFGYVALKEIGQGLESAAQEWQKIEKSTDRARIEAFRDRYNSDPLYRELADRKLARLSITPQGTDPSPVECDGVALASIGASTRCLEPGDEFTECDACPTMVVVPSGRFTMGSPSKEKSRDTDELPHDVIIDRPFAVGKFEISVNEFRAFADDGFDFGDSCRIWNGKGFDEISERSFLSPGFPQTVASPAVCISWHDAKSYVKWLSKETGHSYKLLSEAEWEYVARANTTTPYSTGRSIGNAQANFLSGDHDQDRSTEKTMEGNNFPANNFKLHAMHGNVWEWVEDCYASYADAPADGTAHKEGEDCEGIIRGGGWSSNRNLLRSGNRAKLSRDQRSQVLGFRVARTF